MTKLNRRQLNILDFIRRNEGAQNKDIKEHLEKSFGEISRFTIIRDLDLLLGEKMIKKVGAGRSATYFAYSKNPMMAYFDPSIYFEKGPDERNASVNFNFESLNYANDILNRDELDKLEKLNKIYRNKIKNRTPAELQKEIERLTIELSWKSSHLEGNTYSLIDTEILLKEKKRATGHTKEETVMILNHKKALDYVFSSKKTFKKITLREIENIHRLLVEDLGVSYGLRKRIVGITGTSYRPMDNQYQIREAMEKMIASINKMKNPFGKALAAILFVAYIQPFEDGNKRTSRILGNAILYAYDICPLSYRSINEAEYKKAVILFYEQKTARYFKELFIKQFEFAVENYF
jgi:Fic family protein